MASALNKRQQARNERALQELIKTVPGNNVCADCGARSPGWASWSLGIFLCMRCATLHRKLGTHISKVKSLSMDKWDNAQVDNMKRLGNIESNKAYNPRNVKPSIPVDIDEVDSAMERFIRQKYQERVFMVDSRPGTRQNTGSTSSEDRPPPLPPKPTSRFGFRLQKSAAPSKNVTPPMSPGLSAYNADASPPRVNKPSRVFGSSVQGDGLESKLATLRDMGFPDEKRNSQVLRGLNGNLDKAVEALIRLGEQNPKSRGTTPTPPDKPNTDGLSFDNLPASKSSMNPFDALDAVAAQQQHQRQQPPPLQTHQLPYGTMSETTTPSNAYNPFLAQQSSSQQQQQQQQQQYPQPQQAFAQQQNPYAQQQQQQQPQQLFPNRTGGYGQPQTPQYPQTNPFQHSFTPPPMPQVPQQYAPFFAPQQTGTQSLISPTGTGASNPFLKSVKSQVFAPTQSFNPFNQAQQQQQQPQTQQFQQPVQQQQQPQQSHQSQQFQQLQQQHQQQAQNPFMPQSQAQQPQQAQAQNPWQNQPQQQQQQQPQQLQAQNPWQSPQNQQQQQPQNPWQNQQQQQQSPYQTPQATSAFDKNSILALYNYPHLAPQQPQSSQQPSPTQQQQQQPTSTPTPQSPSTLTAGNLNPFAANNGQPNGQGQQQQHQGQQQHQQQQQQQQQMPKPSPLNQVRNAGHVSNESVDFAGLMGGRHSPDAFSGLSASFRR